MSSEQPFTPTPANPAFLDVGCLAVAVFAVIFGGWVTYSIATARPDLNDPGYWPTTTGTITAEALQTGLDAEGAKVYRARLGYHYLVDGHPYVGTSVHQRHPGHSAEFKSEAAARRFIERYPVGSEVEVSYHPERPAEAVVEPHTKRRGWLLWVGLLIAGGGLGLLATIGALVAGVPQKLLQRL